jgi:hypothetical protein
MLAGDRQRVYAGYFCWEDDMKRLSYSDYRSFGHGRFISASLSVSLNWVLAIACIVGIIIGIVL